METIVNAIRQRRCLAFRYHGYLRTVEPHTFGIDRQGHHALRAYQTSGGSQSGEQTWWKLFHLSDMRELSML